MNWEQLILLMILLAIFFLIAVTLVFYLRHWASRPESGFTVTPLEGLYFKRYLPEQLRSDHGRQQKIRQKRDRMYRSLLAKTASATIIPLAVTTAAYSLVTNISIYLLPIDLEPEEIAGLDYTQHQWFRDIDERLPDLSAVLKEINVRGFILPYGNRDSNWLPNGINLREMAYWHWRHFAQKYNFEFRHCQWESLSECRNDHQGWIILVLPGYWDFQALDTMLEKGANIIAYGPPVQVYVGAKDTTRLWQGMTFKSVLKREGGAIILRGDQLLTLGFDAGLIIEAYSPFVNFHVTSQEPQALSIGNLYEPGGEHETRLFAKTVGPGRLVWLDFPPDPADHDPGVNVRHLNSLMASVFRYLSRQTYSAIATWPQAKQFAALLDEDTEDGFANAEAVVELARKKSFPISWYILSNEALKNRWLTRSMAETGEIACHGDHHGAFTKNSRREQIIRIARCQKVLWEITGVKPLAFRPPKEEYNSATVDAVINNGMTHYIAENSPDRAVPELQMSLVNGKSLVSIPRMVSDDYETWHTQDLNHTQTIQLFNKEIEWMRMIGGLYMYSFHSQYMGKHENLNAIEYLGDKLKELNTYFSTSNEIAQWWQFRVALQRGSEATEDQINRFSPVFLSVNKQGELSNKPYHANVRRGN